MLGYNPAEMSGWAWKVRRLRAMSLQEIGVRAVRMVREQVAPLPKEPPEQTWRRWVRPETEAHWLAELPKRLVLYPDCLPDALRERLIAEANALLSGRWQLFGYEVRLADPPDWNLNPVLGKAWMSVPAKQIDYRRIDVAGGVKYVWELSRHQPLLRLAQAYALTGETRYAETCLRWWLDWIERNPRGWGIHWTSALEHAIRVFVWLYCLRLMSDYEPIQTALPRLGGALIQHGEYIERHLSPGSSANNHLIGEVASLAFAGSLLPDCALARRWQAVGYRILEQEALRQFYEDGVNAEQGFGYLPFVWEFYLHAYRLRPMPEAVRERLARSIEFVRNVMDASGYVPQVGDEDDGTVVPMWSRDADRYRVVGRALAMLVGCEPPPNTPLPVGEGQGVRATENLTPPAPVSADSPHPPHPSLSQREREGAYSPLPVGEGQGVRADRETHGRDARATEAEGQGVRADQEAHGRDARATEAEGQGVRANPDDTLAYWLFGKPAGEGSRLMESRVYPKGGYAVLHSARWQVLFDAGPLGLGSLSAHGHADALSVWASLDGKPLLIDTGTYAYHEDPAWRDHFRGTSAHNTVQCHHRNQSEILGPFLWGRKANATLKANPERNEAEGTHDGYAPDYHTRKVRLSDKELIVEDAICADTGFPWQWHWHFHPRWQVRREERGMGNGERGVVWYISDGESQCELRVENLPSSAKVELFQGTGETPSVGWYSPRFGQKVPCTTLRVEVSGAELEGEVPIVWRFQAVEGS